MKCPIGPYDRSTSDGCTLFPDKSWGMCCVEHDERYYYGGGSKQRMNADVRLLNCVSFVGHPYIAIIMFLGVRFFGGPAWPHKFRWGKGMHYCDSFTYAKQYLCYNKEGEE